MGAKPEPCYNQIRAINNRVIMRLQCMFGSQKKKVEKLMHSRLPVL